MTATVDLVVEFGADGTIGPVEVSRWAGFGLDEAAAESVRARPFLPATVAGKPVSCRALLRYNFRVRDELIGTKPFPRRDLGCPVQFVKSRAKSCEKWSLPALRGPDISPCHAIFLELRCG